MRENEIPGEILDLHVPTPTVEAAAAAASPQLVAYLNPTLVSGQHMARDVLRSTYTRTLGAVTTAAL